jgi:hypothetical protein
MKQLKNIQSLGSFSLFPDKTELDVRIAARSDTLPTPHLWGEDSPTETENSTSLIMSEV